jgi:hypothetical protein
MAGLNFEAFAVKGYKSVFAARHTAVDFNKNQTREFIQ